MKKKTLLPGLLLLSAVSFGQVGINTETPTEILDIDGTMRVRSLPDNGTPNAIYTTGENTSSGTTPTETFTATRTLVLDGNGVLGTVQGLPSLSNTNSWLGNSGAATGADQPNARTISFGPLSVAFFKTNNNSNAYQFWIKSSATNEAYIVDERIMTGGATYTRVNGTMNTANTWTRMGTNTYAFGSSWHVNIWLSSTNRIYKLTVMSIFVGNTSANNRLTLNIQEL